MRLGVEPMSPDPLKRYAAEFVGTAALLATVVGSGIMGESLAGGNVAIALLANIPRAQYLPKQSERGSNNRRLVARPSVPSSLDCFRRVEGG